jgi:hypothetical protein
MSGQNKNQIDLPESFIQAVNKELPSKSKFAMTWEEKDRLLKFVTGDDSMTFDRFLEIRDKEYMEWVEKTKQDQTSK